MPGSSTAVSRRAHKTDATTELPYEVKAAIVSHLNGQDTKQVSLVNRAWKAATEDHLWARVRIPPVIDHDQWGKTCTPGLKEAESWKLFRQLLERNPARVSAIREMTVLLAPKAMEDRLAILKLVSPYITKWTDVYSCSTDVHGEPHEPCCDWASMIHLSLATNYMPALQELKVHVDGTWSLTLPGLLRQTPNLTRLHLEGHTEDVTPGTVAELWPKLKHLTRLDVKSHAKETKSSLVRTIVPLCESLITFNLGIPPTMRGTLEDMPLYLEPVVASSTIENVLLDLPWRDRETPWWVPVILELEDNPPRWKNLHVRTNRIQVRYMPAFPCLETFRMTTRVDQESGPLGIVSNDIRRGLVPSEFGQVPSKTTSGFIHDELRFSIMANESLVLIEAGYNHVPPSFPPTGPDDISHSLHIQTFVKDGVMDDDDRDEGTLVRCWMAAESSLFRLGPHDFNLELPLLAIEEDVNTWDGSIEFGYHFCQRYMSDNFEIPARLRLPGSTPDPKWIELTYYRGRSLPFIVLDYMYSQIGHERFPARGQRGLGLPKFIWSLLDGWYEELEERIDHFDRFDRSRSTFDLQETLSEDEVGGEGEDEEEAELRREIRQILHRAT